MSHSTRRFVTVRTRALYGSLLWTRLIRSISPHPISLRPILQPLSYIIYSCVWVCDVQYISEKGNKLLLGSKFVSLISLASVLFWVSLCQVMGAFLLVVAVRGGHLDQSGGYGVPTGSSYGPPVVSAPYGGGGYSGGSTYTGAGYSSSGHGGYYDQVIRYS